jgi:hypothetical protein
MPLKLCLIRFLNFRRGRGLRKLYQNAEDEVNSIFAAFDCQPIPRSGAGLEKLDSQCYSGKLSGYKISTKHTTKKSFSVQSDDWAKDELQARHAGCKLFRQVKLENLVTGKYEWFTVIKTDRFLEVLASNEED